MAVNPSASTVLILAGGTGGHVYPALAVAQELQARGFNIRWLGTERGLENRVVLAAGLALDFIRVRGLRGKGALARVQAVLMLIWASAQSLFAVVKIKPDCVLGMGGYVSGPAGIAAWLLRKPLVIHEQNSVAGTTNRLLSRFSTRVLAAYPNAFSSTAVDAEVVGNPVRQALLARGLESAWHYDGQRPLRLFVVGGSLGAKAINDVLPQALALLSGQSEVQVRHQTGMAHSTRVMADYQRLNLSEVEVLPYIEDMAAMYEWSDLVLCRAGALTVAELTIMGRPSILVPLPQAIDNHQAHNAYWLRDQGGALVVDQSDLSAEKLSGLLLELKSDTKRLRSMSEASAIAAFPEATQRVADVCVEAHRVD